MWTVAKTVNSRQICDVTSERSHNHGFPRRQFNTRVECVGVFLNEMNASFFTIASLSLKMAEIATSGWSTLADIENSYFKGGYKKSYWGTLFDHRQMLFKNSINKTERLYPFKIKNIKILPFCIIAMDVMSFFFSIFPLVWFCCVSFLRQNYSWSLVVTQENHVDEYGSIE